MNTWTDDQLLEEWRHVYETRLAILGAYRSGPTQEQRNIARDEADEHIRKLKAQEKE